MGLAQQIAFSSLLAFFPAVVFLVGLLDLVNAYPTLKDFLAPIAPGNLQVHWPEGNVLIGERRSPEAEIPDYNARVEVLSLAG